MIRQNAGQRIFMVGCSAGDDHMECSSMSEVNGDVALLIKILRDKQLPIWRYINLMPYMALPILSRFILTGHSFSKHCPSSKTRRKNRPALFHDRFLTSPQISQVSSAVTRSIRFYFACLISPNG